MITVLLKRKFKKLKDHCIYISFPSTFPKVTHFAIFLSNPPQERKRKGQERERKKETGQRCETKDEGEETRETEEERERK